ncbi:aminotransferase class V-fold PLP-dependent enzyme [Maribacter sp. ACAM166]|uniref:aminotransferase class V-fold PLP-dependent enzyme n=1 Tax=Maribacter sp. ACAM166 TaxID=2508996 RepID=UPI0010FE67F8|nr:aminotransferase class V-fold PLP-dependent enzyme [Maribacter sp. ACAM166]TLP81272.1 aminotransferase class V-fold PLP-dependent enzyme [Maribacter sp. ACAM166]
MNIEQIRSLFPVTNKAVYLNSASQSPLNILVNNKLQAYLKKEVNLIDKKGFNRDKIRTLLSKLLGGSPEEYALTTSTGVGLGIVAQGLAFKKGDNIILPELEHWNNTFPWLNLEKKGVEIRFVQINEDKSIDPESIEKLIDHRTRVVAIAAVRFNSGFRPNLSAIGKIAHEKGALFIVDAAQGAGMVPIDVEKDQIDVMSGCGFKWLLGMHGTGFLYVSKRVVKMINPILPGMFSAETVHDKLSYYDDSRKFETGTIAYSLFSAWSAGLQLILDIGIENIYKKALENTDFMIDGLQEKGCQIRTPIKKREERTAIVHFNMGSFKTTKALYENLKENKILVTLQGENIRVSPNFFTTKSEIRLFLNLI